MDFRCLSAAEIQAKYRRANDKSEMLKILCELTCSTQEEMRDFLGLEVIPEAPKGRKQVAYIDNDKARALYDEGMSDQQIADALGVNIQGVRNWRGRNRLRCHEKYATRALPVAIDEAKARTLYDKGMSDQHIARVIGATPSSVRSWRRRNNIPGNGGCSSGFKEKQSECERLYRQGKSDKYIAMCLGVSISSVAHWRARNSLPANFKKGCYVRDWEDEHW